MCLIEGKIYRDGRFWLSEIPMLDLATQGMTKKEACEMAIDAAKELLEKSDFDIRLVKCDKEKFYITSENIGLLLSLSLKRLRQREKLSIGDVAASLNFKSRNSYAQYETGKLMPTIQKYSEMIEAITKNSVSLNLAS